MIRAQAAAVRRSPYLALYCLAPITVLALALDSAHPDIGLQTAMGLICFALLLGVTARCPATERRAVFLCVAVATCVEIFGSIIWGAYRYKLHNIPLYVPPGHGIVYFMALRLSQSPLFTARPRQTIRWGIVAALTWAVLGLTVLPLLVHRLDVFGAFWAIYFVCFTLRTQRGGFFVAVFVVTSCLELVGTGLGTWAWQATDPVFGIPSGNPPSVIAGGYCIVEGSVIGLALFGTALQQRFAARSSLIETALPGWLRRRDGPLAPPSAEI